MTVPSPSAPRKSFIFFMDPTLSKSGKTQEWLVYAKGGGQLGVVKWFARWRCYAFFPHSETVFEKWCLRDLAKFCDGVTTDHREKR